MEPRDPPECFGDCGSLRWAHGWQEQSWTGWGRGWPYWAFPGPLSRLTSNCSQSHQQPRKRAVQAQCAALSVSPMGAALLGPCTASTSGWPSWAWWATCELALGSAALHSAQWEPSMYPPWIGMGDTLRVPIIDYPCARQEETPFGKMLESLLHLQRPRWLPALWTMAWPANHPLRRFCCHFLHLELSGPCCHLAAQV